MKTLIKQTLLLALACLATISVAQENRLSFGVLSGTNMPDIKAGSVASEPDGNNSDESDGSEEVVLNSCSDILANDAGSASGIYTVTGGTVYCDMTTDGGGWQLVANIAKHSTPASLRTIADYQSDVTAIGSLDDPSKSYMYKGSYDNFTSVRESISCATASDCRHAYGANMSASGLMQVRQLWASEKRTYANLSDIPSCSNNYANFQAGINDISHCSTLSQMWRSGSGWQVDIHNTSGCWLMRGAETQSTAQGSALCPTFPNGSRHAFLWMR